MLTNFFGKSKPINNIVILTLFLCYMVIAFFTSKIPLIGLLNVVLILVMLSMVIFIKIKNQLTADNSFGFLCFVILIGFFPKTILLNGTFYAHLVLLLSFRKLYSLHSPKKSIKKMFDGGFWIGIAFLIEPLSLIFGLLLYASIFLYKGLSLQYVCVAALGFLAPLILGFTYYYWTDSPDIFYNLFTWPSNFSFSHYNTFPDKLRFSIISVLVISALLLKTSKFIGVHDDARKRWILICLHFILSIVIFLVDHKNGAEVLYLLFPTSIILTNGLELFQKTKSRWYIEVILLLFMLSSFAIYTL